MQKDKYSYHKYVSRLELIYLREREYIVGEIFLPAIAKEIFSNYDISFSHPPADSSCES